MPTLILASNSPRRKQALRRINIPFLAVPNHINEEDEMQSVEEDPETVALYLSRRKAESVSHQYPDRFILGMDTIVAKDGRVIGKPTDEEDAFRILSELNGRWHTVITGVTLLNSQRGYFDTLSVHTKVKFKEFSAEEVRSYLKTGESLDKAGAYGIQSKGGALVETIEGDFSNVVGFPESAVLAMLEQAGIYDRITDRRKEKTEQR